MTYILFLLLPLPFTLTCAYYFNKRKRLKREGSIYITTLLDGFGSYLVVTAIFLEGFFESWIYSLIVLIVGLILIAITKNNLDGIKVDFEVQLETVQNIIVLFASMVLPLYIALTMFRYMPVINQILYSLLFVVVVNILFFFLRKYTSIIYDKLSFRNSIAFRPNGVYLYLIIAGFVFGIMLLNFPKTELNNITNLQHHNDYLETTIGYTDAQNRFDEELIFEVTSSNTGLHQLSEGPILNIYDNHIIVRNRGSNYLYNLSTGVLEELDDAITTQNGITITEENLEENESIISMYCEETDNCEIMFTYELDGIKFPTYDDLIELQNLSYDSADYGVVEHGSIYLFKDDEFDSRYRLLDKKPFFELSRFHFDTYDIDQYNGEIYILQVTEDKEESLFQVYKLIEKEIGLELPFYGHYSSMGLVVILLFGLLPIVNIDYQTTVESFDEIVVKQKEKSKVE